MSTLSCQGSGRLVNTITNTGESVYSSIIMWEYFILSMNMRLTKNWVRIVGKSDKNWLFFLFLFLNHFCRLILLSFDRIFVSHIFVDKIKYPLFIINTYSPGVLHILRNYRKSCLFTAAVRTDDHVVDLGSFSV